MEGDSGVLKKKQYRLAGVILLVLTAAMIMLTWKPWNKTDVTLTLGMFAGSNWDVPSGDSYAIVDRVIERFEEKHPGVHVTYTSGILKRDYSEWLSEQILLGDAPDVYFILSDDFNLLSSVGALKDLDELAGADGEFGKERYYQAAYQFGENGGKQYALPYESVPILMFVNKTLLEKEGIPMPGNDWTWDEFYDICKKVTRDTDGNGVTDQFGCYDFGWKNAVYTNGARLFSEDGNISYFGDSRVEEAIRFVKDLNDLNEGYAVSSKEFDMGRVAFRPFAFSDYRTYKPYPWSIKKYSGFEWDCIKMPAGREGGNVSELDTLLMGINDGTRKEALAWDLLKMFCYDEETQRMLFTDSQGVSVLKDVTESSEVMELLNEDTPGGSSLDMTLLSQAMENGISAPKFRKYEEAMTRADNQVSQIISGQKTLDNGLLVLQREINNYLRN